MIETAIQPVTGASNNRHRSKQDYETPWAFIRAVEARFGPLWFDLAADAKNTKSAAYFSELDDSLKQPWHEMAGLLWLNPPFANIAPWAKKCAEEARLGARILLLTPASVDSNWWDAYVHACAGVLFVNPRISFDGKNPYPKPMALSCYNMLPAGSYMPWRWKI